jgi:molybdenum cofactor biosynthesis enzyme MoaA
MENKPIIQAKTRDREPPSFANINLLGKCNCNCYFCLGKDIEDICSDQNQLNIHFDEWPKFYDYLFMCSQAGIKKIYITGLNCDSLQYKYLQDLVDTIQRKGFGIGLRTNGYLAHTHQDTINKCNLETGYTIMSLKPEINRIICGRADLPDWKTLIPASNNTRIQIVIGRYNQSEFFDMVRFIKQFSNVPYIQIRKISTDTRLDLLQPDMDAFETLYAWVKKVFPIKERLWGDAETYDILGVNVNFWRTIKTTVNSYNYFTDGTISPEYFILEGYLKNKQSKSV